MPKNTEPVTNEKRRKDTIQGTIIISIAALITPVVLLVLRWHYAIGGILGAAMLIISLLDLGAQVPIWILFSKRLKEIEGGEEDAAAQY